MCRGQVGQITKVNNVYESKKAVLQSLGLRNSAIIIRHVAYTVRSQEFVPYYVVIRNYFAFMFVCNKLNCW